MDHLPCEITYRVVRFPVIRLQPEDMPTGLDGAPVCGQYDGNRLQLRVRMGLAPMQAWATLFHEVAHHSLEMAGDSRQESAESLCDWLGWAIVELLVQNPDLQCRLLMDLAPGGLA
jgi:hypothetical protein